MFLLLAAPSAPAEVTVLHVSSQGAAMGTGVSSPAVLRPPAQAPAAAGPSGQVPGQDKEGVPAVDGTHILETPSMVLSWGSTMGRGLKALV